MKIYYLGVNLKYIKTVSRYHAFKDSAKEEITSLKLSIEESIIVKCKTYFVILIFN
jgi:hypothetical protein